MNTKQKGIIAIVGLALILSLTGLFARILGEFFTPLQQVYLRVGIAFVLSIVVFAKHIDYKKITLITTGEWGLLVLRALSTYLLGVVPFSVAVGMAKLSTVSFIDSLPIVALLGVLVLGEKLTRQKMLYLFTGFLGVMLVSVKDYSLLLSWGKGELLALFSIVFVSLGQVLRSKHTQLLNNYEISSLLLFIATIVLWALSLLLGERVHIPVNTSVYYALLGAGGINVAYQLAANYGFAHVEAVLANNLLTIAPIFSIILGFMFYAEVPTGLEYIAGCIILASAYGMNRATQ